MTMPSLDFKRQFADAVKSGKKRQTIRASGRRDWQAGDTLHFFTGLRSGDRKRLGKATLLSVQAIRIDCAGRHIDLEKTLPHGVRYMAPLFDDEAREVARADGFASLDAFFEFFQEQHGRHLGGYLLKW
jgi:hypothetical protein